MTKNSNQLSLNISTTMDTKNSQSHKVQRKRYYHEKQSFVNFVIFLCVHLNVKVPSELAPIKSGDLI